MIGQFTEDQLRGYWVFATKTKLAREKAAPFGSEPADDLFDLFLELLALVEGKSMPQPEPRKRAQPKCSICGSTEHRKPQCKQGESNAQA
jgi:hypothetical protein